MRYAVDFPTSSLFVILPTGIGKTSIVRIALELQRAQAGGRGLSYVVIVCYTDLGQQLNDLDPVHHVFLKVENGSCVVLVVVMVVIVGFFLRLGLRVVGWHDQGTPRVARDQADYAVR